MTEHHPAMLLETQSVKRSPLSKQVWGLDLAQGLPRVISSDAIEVRCGDIAQVATFIASEFPALTEEWHIGPRNAAAALAKRRYLDATCDVLELRHAGRIVGVLVGAPEDWSSYYIRMFAFLPGYQRASLWRRFIRECLFEPLQRHGVERVTADSSPSNVALSHAFNSMQFHVTGHALTERWGPLVRYTHFLQPEVEQAFHARFSRPVTVPR